MNLLVVEDEPTLRNTLAAALASCGHEVSAVEDGVEAFARARAARPDLVVLDLQLPEMDGWEFLRRFRAEPGCAHVPVVVTSAAHNVVRSQLDAQAFFAKPFDLDALLDSVDELLGAFAGAIGE
jgi:CheY-like chemotaxis protein